MLTLVCLRLSEAMDAFARDHSGQSAICLGTTSVAPMKFQIGFLRIRAQYLASPTLQIERVERAYIGGGIQEMYTSLTCIYEPCDPFNRQSSTLDAWSLKMYWCRVEAREGSFPLGQMFETPSMRLRRDAAATHNKLILKSLQIKGCRESSQGPLNGRTSVFPHPALGLG